LPFPSIKQSKESILKTVVTFTEPVTADEDCLKKYQIGLQVEESFLKSATKTHCSLVSSGCLESSRSQGGRGFFLVSQTKKLTDVPFYKRKDLIGQKDQFGFTILDPVVWQMANELDWELPSTRIVQLGDLLYLKAEEFPTWWAQIRADQQVPKYLGHILNWTATMLMLSVGEMNYSFLFRGYPVFNCPPEFRITGTIKVRADASIEAGMKTRLITMASAGFAHLSQLASNLMRDYLSSDPFCRVGFEEADKLWEVLKGYQKNYEKQLVGKLVSATL
jgi:hypothetical protein